MQWFDTSKLHPETCKRFLSIFLLALIVIVNLGSVFCDFGNQKHSLDAVLLSRQNQALLKEVNTNLQAIALTLQQHSSASNQTLTKVTTQLAAIQNMLVNLPNQDNFKQLEGSILQLNKNTLAANQTANKEHAAHHTTRASRETHHLQHPARTALPFVVNSIDIWNGEPYATINVQGSPDLMTTGDTRLGWKLTSLSFANNQATFTNHHHQFIKVNIT